MTPETKAQELFDIFGKELAIKCCDQVLGFMGADRGYSFWYETKLILKERY